MKKSQRFTVWADAISGEPFLKYTSVLWRDVWQKINKVPEAFLHSWDQLENPVDKEENEISNIWKYVRLLIYNYAVIWLPDIESINRN